jgi:hypothetical protein
MLFSHRLPSLASGSEVENENDGIRLIQVAQNIMYEF